MKIKLPEPFTFEAGPRAVLLLHGFAGHTADVRMLGRYLEKQGYTSHAPIYAGHGQAPEELINANAEDWLKDVQNAYNHLKELGYDEIAVAGLSLGGALTLRLASTNPVKGIIPMCAPMFFDNKKELSEGIRFKAREFKQLEGKKRDTIDQEVDNLLGQTDSLLADMGDLIETTKNQINSIDVPAFVVQARQDEMININSAPYIYEHIASAEKELKWYEHSGHVVTLGNEKEQLHEDIYQFLESLNWKQ